MKNHKSARPAAAQIGDVKRAAHAQESRRRQASARTKTEYVCPMHPQIVRDEPGSCPICGMALEPRLPMPDDQEDPELASIERRLWGSALLAAPILAVAMSEMWPGLIPAQWFGPLQWLQLALATPVVLWGGWLFFQRGWDSFVQKSLNMFSLIAIGTGAAYLYSLVAVCFPQLFPEVYRSSLWPLAEVDQDGPSSIS